MNRNIYESVYEVESILKTSADIGPVGDSSEIQAILTRDMEQLVGMLDRLSRRDGHWHTCQQPPTDAVMWWWGGLKGTVRFSQPERQGGSADSSRDARIHT